MEIAERVHAEFLTGRFLFYEMLFYDISVVIAAIGGVVLFIMPPVETVHIAVVAPCVAAEC